MKLVTVQEMRAIEKASDAAGHHYGTMMDRAGGAVAQVVTGRIGSRRARVLVLVGPGNNGGDGLVAAKVLAQAGHKVTLYLWKRQAAPDALLTEAISAGSAAYHCASDPDLSALATAAERCDVVVDALLGTGARGVLRDGAEAILATVGKMIGLRRAAPETALLPLGQGDCSGAPHAGPLIVAVDVPSGMDADTGAVDPSTLVADLCVTFAYPKRGHFRYPGASRVGELIVADIGISPALSEGIAASVVTRQRVAQKLPGREPNAHKGTFGRVLVIAGSANYLGAPALAGRAAYRIGAGLVTLAIPAPIQMAVASQLPEATYLALPNDMGVITPQAMPVICETVDKYQALLVGPGLSQERAARDLVRALVERGRRPRQAIGFIAPREEAQGAIILPPMVIDADGLNALARMEGWWRLLPEGTILTPHPVEMARLMGIERIPQDADRLAIAREAAERWGCTVVLKGAYTAVTSPGGKVEVIPFAEPALATAGSGDVLAGTIAGLLAQGLAPHEAGVSGAYIHALAGVLWATDRGHAGLLAGELADQLPAALRTLRP
ncbi:MAG: NAD(P)H-hydrate dehydratase [Chloroflexi bacterium]|nr:NAD(P)H-hydrate dehydratase [Chloroflexota bacterium]